MSQFESMMNRIVEGSPLIVVLLIIGGGVVWRTWREERAEMLAELREEREARREAHKEMLGVAERSVASVHAVREAINELRHAIQSANHRG